MTLIHAPKVTKIICPPLPGHIIHPLFHNGSKIRVSVPLRKPLSPCTLSTAPVRHLPSVTPFHNGSKIRVSVPLRKPLSPCTLSTYPCAASSLRLPFPQRQQNPRFGAVAEAAFPMYPLHRPLCGIFPPPPLSTTAVKSAFRCRCGSHRQSVSLL